MDRSLRNVLVGTFTLRFSTGLTGLMLVHYLKDLPRYGGEPVSALEVALVAITFYGTELTLSPLFGVVCDRLGWRPVMQLGPAFGAIAVVVTGLTTSLPLLLGTRLLEGASTAASVPAILAFLAVATADDEGLRGRAMARFELATLGGLALGGVAAGVLWERIGQVAFFLNAGFYGVSYLIYTYGVRATSAAVPRAEAQRHGPRRYIHLLTRSHVLLLAPTWIALNAAIGTFSFQTVFQLRGSDAPYAKDQLLMQGFSPIEISAGLGVGMLVFVGGIVFWGNQFRRFRRTTIITLGAGSALAGIVDLFILNHTFGAPPVGALGMGLVAAAALFVLAGATPAALGLLADISEAYPHDRGAIMGLYSVFLGVGQIVGNTLAGFAAEFRGIDGLLGLTFGLVVVALVPLHALRSFEHRIGGPTPAVVPHPGEVPLD